MRRTTLLIVGGSTLFGLFLVASKVFGDSIIDPTGFAIRTFVGIWLFAAFANLFAGLMEAGPGHTFMDEFQRFLAVFSIPVAIALMLPWKFIITGY